VRGAKRELSVVSDTTGQALTTKKKRKAPKTAFKPGVEWRGNAKGRPIGARNRFSEEYVNDFHDVWRRMGKAAIEELAVERPLDFVRIGAMILSKQVDQSEDQTGGFLEVLKALGRASRPRDREPITIEHA
jgi:hypothetical protein